MVELLRRHVAAGRLDAEELEARLERVYAATYVGEAEAALAELPREPDPGHPAARAPRRRSSTRVGRATVIVAAAAVLALVTALTGVWALWWLMWPIAIVAKGLGRDRRPAQGWSGPRHGHRGAAA